MKKNDYLDMLRQRLSGFFDEKPAPAGSSFDFCAELNASDEGYFLVPNLKTYSVRHNEYVYLKLTDGLLTAASMEPYLESVIRIMKELKTTTEHMSSIFSVVFVTERQLSPDEEKAVRAVRFHKDYAFTLKGWSDLAVFAISTSEQKIICNKAGQKTLDYYKFPG